MNNLKYVTDFLLKCLQFFQFLIRLVKYIDVMQIKQYNQPRHYILIKRYQYVF